ncbi:chymotrypsin inhibitor-like [Vespula maculifrons]|uniref:Chymotrypsin inhibitor-like n=1 Tax=Vespula maculifrons TaxID=7453 RepID=A0ABD2CQ81_VESMC
MSRVIFALLVLVAIASANPLQRTNCGENEEFVTCGSACEPSCGVKTDICTLQCIIGCQCKEGYLRSGNGACVSPNTC